MKKTILLSLLTAVVVMASGEYSNRRAPGFSLPDSFYQQHDPQDYRGKVLIVDIMTTHCPECTKLADVLVELKGKYRDKLAVLSVVTMPDNPNSTDQFKKEHKITWPFLFDSGQMISSYLRVTPSNPEVHFPHIFLIDKDGMIRNDFGPTDEKSLTVEGLAAEIDKLVK